MLFRKKMPSSCQYCTHGVRLDDEQIVCTKKGLLHEDRACRRFRYDPVENGLNDPLKRIPPRKKAVDFSKYDQEDFSL